MTRYSLIKIVSLVLIFVLSGCLPDGGKHNADGTKPDIDKVKDDVDKLDLDKSIKPKKLSELSAQERDDAISKLASLNTEQFLRLNCKVSSLLDEKSAEKICEGNLKLCETISIGNMSLHVDGVKKRLSSFFTKCPNLITEEVFDYTKKALQALAQLSQKKCSERAQLEPSIEQLRKDPVGAKIEGCFDELKSALRLIIEKDSYRSKWVTF